MLQRKYLVVLRSQPGQSQGQAPSPEQIQKMYAMFNEWKEKQVAAVQALAASEVVADADKMISLFKKYQADAFSVTKLEEERQARLRRSEGVQGRGGRGVSGDSSADGLWNQITRDRSQSKAGS